MTGVQDLMTPLTVSMAEGLERRRRHALVTADHRMLREIVAAECVYVHATGMLESGTSYVDRFAAGAFSYQSIAVDEVEVALAGCCAVVVYRQRAEMTIDGAVHASQARCCATWIHAGGHVRLLAFQSTPLSH